MSEQATLPNELTLAQTPLTSHLLAASPALTLREWAGTLTPKSFTTIAAESNAAINAVACFDLGYRTRIRITGEDRLRWLNGMVSNTIQTLPESHGNYNFILNAQGRIQGDAYIYRRINDLLLDTDRSQAARLFAHLDHFIIMDDVELHPLDDSTTGIGLAGPRAAALLDDFGLRAFNLGALQLSETELAGVPVTLVHAYSPFVPRFELWFAPEAAPIIWQALTAAGATPAGIDTIDALRIYQGTPAYGIDITDRHLPQETAQDRALNFTKGCYLGQEIVERIRSRATVHRSIRQFQLTGDIPSLPADLHAEGDAAAIGQLTSAAEINISNFQGIVALGSIRNEALARKAAIVYEGGAATVLEHPPLPPQP